MASLTIDLVCYASLSTLPMQQFVAVRDSACCGFVCFQKPRQFVYKYDEITVFLFNIDSKNNVSWVERCDLIICNVSGRNIVGHEI